MILSLSGDNDGDNKDSWVTVDINGSCIMDGTNSLFCSPSIGEFTNSFVVIGISLLSTVVVAIVVVVVILGIISVIALIRFKLLVFFGIPGEKSREMDKFPSDEVILGLTK